MTKITYLCYYTGITSLYSMDNFQLIQSKIHEIRGYNVMLDFDLAEMYGTETKYLKRAVRNNIKRFPSDFMF